MGCLSAIARTQIQDGFAREGGKKDGGQLSGLILNLKKAFMKGFLLSTFPRKFSSRTP